MAADHPLRLDLRSSQVAGSTDFWNPTGSSNVASPGCTRSRNGRYAPAGNTAPTSTSAYSSSAAP